MPPTTAAPSKDPTERISHGVQNSPLPPSVEAAYYRKCIDLKRRVDEIEANNDRNRASIARHQEAIRKLRLERAWLLETLQREMSGKDKLDKEDEEEEDIEESRERGDTTEEEEEFVRKRKVPEKTAGGPRKRKSTGKNASAAAIEQSSPPGSTKAKESTPPNGSAPAESYSNGHAAGKADEAEALPEPKQEDQEGEEDVAMGGTDASGFTAVNNANHDAAEQDSAEAGTQGENENKTS